MRRRQRSPSDKLPTRVANLRGKIGLLANSGKVDQIARTNRRRVAEQMYPHAASRVVNKQVRRGMIGMLVRHSRPIVRNDRSDSNGKSPDRLRPAKAENLLNGSECTQLGRLASREQRVPHTPSRSSRNRLIDLWNGRGLRESGFMPEVIPRVQPHAGESSAASTGPSAEKCGRTSIHSLCVFRW